GITGVATAYLLARAGLHVAPARRAAPVLETTYANGGQTSCRMPNYGRNPGPRTGVPVARSKVKTWGPEEKL
ncbi:MAG: hypothetical protein ACP5SH_19550, partial [Syntrophobacteraceae bacterium]